MASSEFTTIQAALERLHPTDQAIHQGLGLTKRQAEFFWAALNAVSENGGLAIPDLLKLIGKLNKYPSPYITELKKRGVIQQGKMKGEWRVAAKAVHRLESLLSGETVPAERSAERTVQGNKKVTKRFPKNLAKMTIGQLIESLNVKMAKLDARIAKLTAEKDNVANVIRTIKGLQR